MIRYILVAIMVIGFSTVATVATAGRIMVNCSLLPISVSFTREADTDEQFCIENTMYSDDGFIGLKHVVVTQNIDKYSIVSFEELSSKIHFSVETDIRKWMSDYMPNIKKRVTNWSETKRIETDIIWYYIKFDLDNDRCIFAITYMSVSSNGYNSNINTLSCFSNRDEDINKLIKSITINEEKF